MLRVWHKESNNRVKLIYNHTLYLLVVEEDPNLL